MIKVQGTRGGASEADKVASRSFGVLTYWRKAALCHRPSVWIIESSRPTSDAVVAAPILKLCPAKSNPIRPRTSRNCATNHGFRTGFFAESRKNGPACEPQLNVFQYGCDWAYIRARLSYHHVCSWSHLERSWSHLERLRWNCTIRGLARESTATSPHDRHVRGL